MFLDLIYPPVCGICGKINKKSLCKKCEIQLKPYEMNSICKPKNKYFDYQIKILKYKGIVRERIIDFKFNEKSYLYKTFAKIILNDKKVYGFLKKYDIIIYVPMYIKKKMLRGYNQCELIAKELASKLQIEKQFNNLKKIKDTKKQSSLIKEERKANIKDAFKINNSTSIINKKIILFDDIYTTGSTVNECSRILKEAGAREVLVLTLAID